MKKTIIIIGGILILSILINLSFTGFYLYSHKPSMVELERLKKNKEYTDSTYLFKIGSTSTYDNKKLYRGKKYLDYELRSWDAGKNWYVIDRDSIIPQNEVIILGDAEDVYPQLLEHLQAWDELENYVLKNGAITGTKQEGIELLKKVGFTVDKEKQIK